MFYANRQCMYGESPINVAAQCTQWPSQQDKYGAKCEGDPIDQAVIVCNTVVAQD